MSELMSSSFKEFQPISRLTGLDLVASSKQKYATVKAHSRTERSVDLPIRDPKTALRFGQHGQNYNRLSDQQRQDLSSIKDKISKRKTRDQRENSNDELQG